MKELGSPQRPSKWVFGSVGGDLLFARNPRVNVSVDSDASLILSVDWKEQTKQALDAKEFVRALSLIQKAIAAEDPQTFELASIDPAEPNFTQGFSKAEESFQKEADLGNAEAMRNLGYLYQMGLGVTQDYDKAREWYQKGADSGDVEAMGSLGRLYRDGNGVATDYGKAWEWFQRAAVAGDRMAQSNLGWLNEQNDLGRWIEDGKVQAWE